jgi:hypothetical protein
MFLVRCEARCAEALAFPARLRGIARAAAAAVATGERRPPRDAFVLELDGETLAIPYRLYYDLDLLRRELASSRADARRILLCLGTRHDDGHVRQECLRQLLNDASHWLTPYLLQLAGEYVIEIAADVAAAIGARNPAALRAFAVENRAYLAALESRATSYWNCYHRQAYPERSRYPGTRVVAAVRAAME